MKYLKLLIFTKVAGSWMPQYEQEVPGTGWNPAPENFCCVDGQFCDFHQYLRIRTMFEI